MAHREISLDRAIVLLYSGVTLASSFVLVQWSTFTAVAVMVTLQVALASLAERGPSGGGTPSREVSPPKVTSHSLRKETSLRGSPLRTISLWIDTFQFMEDVDAFSV